MNPEGPEPREIVLYIPVGGLAATAGIARGAAIVGRPEAGAAEVEIHFEAGALHQRQRETLADRALSASGRLLGDTVGGMSRSVPRDALLVVGVFYFGEGRIVLTGRQSARAVADWLGTPQLDRVELGLRGASDGPRVASVEPPEFTATHLDPMLLRALLDRGGIKADGQEWLASDGRRTAEVGDALIWALERLAQGG